MSIVFFTISGLFLAITIVSRLKVGEFLDGNANGAGQMIIASALFAIAGTLA